LDIIIGNGFAEDMRVYFGASFFTGILIGNDGVRDFTEKYPDHDIISQSTFCTNIHRRIPINPR